MKSKFAHVLSVFVLIIISHSFSFGQTFSKYYESPLGTLFTQSIILTSDSGVLISGSCGNQNEELFFMKTNSAGDTMWSTYLFNINDRYAHTTSLLQLPGQEGYIVTCPNFIVKLSVTGNAEWIKYFVFNNDTIRSYASAQLYKNDSILVVGGLRNTADTDTNLIILKGDFDGHFSGIKTISSNSNSGNALYKKSFGGYLAICNEHTIVSLDSLFNLQWNIDVTTPNSWGIKEIVEGTDSSFWVADFQWGHWNPDDDILYKIDKSGNLLWVVRDDVVTGGYWNVIDGMFPIENGSFIMIGNAILGYGPFYTMTIDSGGNSLYETYYDSLPQNNQLGYGLTGVMNSDRSIWRIHNGHLL